MKTYLGVWLVLLVAVSADVCSSNDFDEAGCTGSCLFDAETGECVTMVAAVSTGSACDTEYMPRYNRELPDRFTTCRRALSQDLCSRTAGCEWDEAVSSCRGRGRWSSCSVHNQIILPRLRDHACIRTSGCVMEDGVCEAAPGCDDLSTRRMHECDLRLHDVDTTASSACEWDDACELHKTEFSVSCLPARQYYCGYVRGDFMCLQHPGCTTNATGVCESVPSDKPLVRVLPPRAKTMKHHRDYDGTNTNTSDPWFATALTLSLFSFFCCVGVLYWIALSGEIAPPKHHSHRGRDRSE